MPLFEDLQSRRFGRFSYIQWIAIAVLFSILFIIAFWAVGELSKPKPEVVDGRAEGFFNGKRYGWFYNAPITPEAEAMGCYNESWLYFFEGTITLTNGEIILVGPEGRRIEGLICKETVNTRKWQSSDESQRTDITFIFRNATITPMPVIDWGPYLPYLYSAAITLAFIWAYWYRKFRLPKFDTIQAKRVFNKYKLDHYLQGDGKIFVRSEEGSGAPYWVGQKVISEDNPYYLILRIDGTRSIRDEIYDDIGDEWNFIFGKDGLKFRQELRRMEKQLSMEEAYDMLENMQKKQPEKEYVDAEKVRQMKRMAGEERLGRDEFNEKKS